METTNCRFCSLIGIQTSRIIIAFFSSQKPSDAPEDLLPNERHLNSIDTCICNHCFQKLEAFSLKNNYLEILSDPTVPDVIIIRQITFDDEYSVFALLISITNNKAGIS